MVLILSGDTAWQPVLSPSSFRKILICHYFAKIAEKSLEFPGAYVGVYLNSLHIQMNNSMRLLSVCLFCSKIQQCPLY